ncbi:MAG: hypothetical protein JHC98_00890 [Thermoleophilaceae bacterium]|nr:hypothetical protein [Thermoleophilaceae bacterium]
MKRLYFRIAVAVAIISAFLAIAPAAMAANPGEVEFSPAGPTQYLATPPQVYWAAYGTLTSANCELARTSPTAATVFPAASCAGAVANAPTVTPSVGLTTYLWDTAPLVAGDGTYRVTYTPIFSPPGTTTATRDFVLDSVQPTVTASAPSGVITDNTPQVGYTVQDVNPDRTVCAADPPTPIVPAELTGFTDCPASPFELPALADGDHNFYVVAQDKAGNFGYALRSFTIDATGPIVTIIGLSEGEILTSAWPPLSISTTDPGTGVLSTTCAYDANAAAQCSDANFLNAPLPDGAHKLTVASSDVAGNVTVRVINFTVDTSGGLTQGLIAPKTAKFVVKRGKLKGQKYATTLTVAFALPAGAPTTACRGSAKINVLVKKKQIGSVGAKFKLRSGKCVATGAAKLSKKFKGKKLSVRFAYKSGPIKAFTLYGSGKL